MKKYPIFTLLIFFFSCASTGQLGTVWEGGKKFIESDTMPTQIFISKEIKSISVMKFDAKSVKTFRGQIIDYVELGDTFTDDVIKKLYSMGKTRVTVGEYLDEIEVTDQVERKVGDVNIKRSTVGRRIKYKAAPFRKVDALLSGRIIRFNQEDPFDKSYIEIYFKLTDTYDGSVYWITRMRGYYGNVISTLVDTIINGEYTEHSDDFKAK